jgi:hypothetical protein
MLTDTPNEIEELQAEIYRTLPECRRLALIDSMYRGGRELADAGLLLRKPDATPRECLENWVRMTVPPEMVTDALEVVVDSADSALREVHDFANKLAGIGMEVVLGGSVAASMYANPRYTQDADVSVRAFPGREQELVKCLEDEYLVSLVAVRSAVAKRRTFNALNKKTSFKIDVFVPADRPFDQAAFARKRLVAPQFPADAPLFVYSPEDVVLHKLAWFRLGNEVATQQLKDVAGVLRVQRPTLDVPYLRQWADELGVADLLESCLAEVNGPDLQE